MGSRGPVPKPADKLLGHRKRTPRAVKAEASPVVEPMEGWLPATKEAWATYWSSDLAAITLGVDRPSIRRLFDMYDQYARAMDVVRAALVVRGSTGQLRTNPLADHALRLDGVILRLENELGLTPAARGRLGISVSRPVADEGRDAPDGGPDLGMYRHLRAVV